MAGIILLFSTTGDISSSLFGEIEISCHLGIQKLQ